MLLLSPPPAPTLVAGARPLAIVPRTLEEASHLAQAIVASGLAPTGLDTPEACLIAILHGLELGLTPLAALQRIAVIDRRPTLWGDGALALVRASGLCQWVREDAGGRDAPRPGAPPVRSSGAARAGRSSAASACRMPGAPGCGAGPGRGASIRSACCRCAPAPLPCATPLPTCWAGSICARSWRTPTRADAGPAPRRCGRLRPAPPETAAPSADRPVDRPATPEVPGAPAPVDAAVAAEDGVAGDRMSPGPADPTGPVPGHRR